MTKDEFLMKWGWKYGLNNPDTRKELEQDLDELLIDLTPSPGDSMVQFNGEWFTSIDHT